MRVLAFLCAVVCAFCVLLPFAAAAADMTPPAADTPLAEPSPAQKLLRLAKAP